jgi:hypothetical protein
VDIVVIYPPVPSGATSPVALPSFP